MLIVLAAKPAPLEAIVNDTKKNRCIRLIRKNCHKHGIISNGDKTDDGSSGKNTTDKTTGQYTGGSGSAGTTVGNTNTRSMVVVMVVTISDSVMKDTDSTDSK